MVSYLKRYRAGEYEQVWQELLDKGSEVRKEPLFEDAYAVAYETMSRARQNIEVMISRLRKLNYEFGIYPDGCPFSVNGRNPLSPPPPTIKDRIQEIEKRVGAIPISLHAWWEVVGSVNFIGRHKGWPEMLDPLFVDSIEAADSEYRDWQQGYTDTDRPRFALPIAPDDFHKDNVSGGPFYQITVPNEAIDAPLENERHHTTFVNYLRICFRSGGFPGSERKERVPEELRQLSKELLPI